MILKLSKDKKLTFYRKNPIYIGEKDFDTIEVLIPLVVDNNETNNLNFILHLVNKNGEYLHINLDKEIKEDIVVGSTKISSTITNEAQNFFLYLELINENNEIIGKTNCVEITIEPLPDEDTRIIPKEEYEEIIDELAEIIQENTEAMNRINGFEDGKSAYEIAVKHGYEGTEEEWLQSLNGKDGKSAYEIAVEQGYEGTEEEWLSEIKDYSKLNNKPSINGVKLSGDKTGAELGLQPLIGNYFTVENNEYISYDFNSVRAGANSVLYCVPFERISNFPNSLVDKISQSGRLYIFHYVHTVVGVRYLIRRIMGYDLNGKYAEFAQYCTVLNDNTFATQSDWVELTGGGSQIVSGVVNQNGTITFTDSDGETFNTSGDNIVTSGNEQISMGYDNGGFYFLFDDGQEAS